MKPWLSCKDLHPRSALQCCNLPCGRVGGTKEHSRAPSTHLPRNGNRTWPSSSLWFLDVSLHSSVRFRNLEIPTRRPQPSGIVTSAVAARSSDLRKQICLNRYSWTQAFSIQRTRLNPFKSLSQLYSRELAHRNGRIHWYEDKTDKTSIWFYLKWESEPPILLPWPGSTSKSTGLSLHLVQKS